MRLPVPCSVTCSRVWRDGLRSTASQLFSQVDRICVDLVAYVHANAAVLCCLLCVVCEMLFFESVSCGVVSRHF